MTYSDRKGGATPIGPSLMPILALVRISPFTEHALAPSVRQAS